MDHKDELFKANQQIGHRLQSRIFVENDENEHVGDDGPDDEHEQGGLGMISIDNFD
jgi:hypothetical protein